MTQFPKILALDLTSARGSLSILEGPSILVERCWQSEQSHAEIVLLELERALQLSGTSLKGIDWMAVVHGPGSFTGIRIGLGTIMGLADVSNQTILGISSLEATAMECSPRQEEIQVVLDAHRNQVFIQTFQWAPATVTPRSSPQCTSTEQWLQSIPSSINILVGDGAIKYQTLVAQYYSHKEIHPGPVCLASAAGKLAFSRWKENRIESPETPQALYIRPPDVFRKQGPKGPCAPSAFLESSLCT